MGEIYDKWSVCDWKVRCWEQETTQVLPFGGEWMVESSYGVQASGNINDSAMVLMAMH